ncbi:MAG TPA: Uma2 family endonuclease [Tepidisphaeraceae bacterium]|jgi:Uma2 family endonuclease
MTAIATPTEQRFILDHADWDLYESLLRGVADQHVFLTFDRGRLELMSPSWKHDLRSRRIALLVMILAEELDVPIIGGGSTTFRSEGADAGLEPDQCFYVQQVDAIRGKDEIDLASDPPPDLAIEVEITQRLSQREAVYARLGVPELWRDDGQTLRIFLLQPDGTYQQSDRGHAFQSITATALTALLNAAHQQDDITWTRSCRQWIQANVKQ